MRNRAKQLAREWIQKNTDYEAEPEDSTTVRSLATLLDAYADERLEEAIGCVPLRWRGNIIALKVKP